jgi:MFS family permease
MSSQSSNTTILLVAIIALGCCNISIGIMVQMVPPNLEALGVSARTIGLNTALGQMGVTICGLLLPSLTQRVSSKPIVLFAMGVLVVTMLAFAASSPLWWWYGVRFANGFGIAAMFTLTETWITMAAGQHRRARIMGIYSTAMTATFGVGPFIVAWTGFKSVAPWLIAVGCLVPGMIGALFVKPENPHADDKGESFLNILRKAPTLYVCIIATTTFEAISLSFFTIYGVRSGLSFAAASQILGTGIIACVVLYYPIGQLADRWSRSGTAIICAAMSILLCAATAFTINHPAIWPVTILLRAVAFGVYIVAITTIGDTFKGRELVSASALVAVAWGIGGMAGPPVVGFMIDKLGIAILPWIMASCYVAAMLALIMNGWRIQPMDKRAPLEASTSA